MSFLSRAKRLLANEDSPSDVDTGAAGAKQFRAELFQRFPFTIEAQQFLHDEIGLVVRDVSSMSGGGFWWPEARKVELFSCQYEAAIHEFAHAWWHDRRLVGGAASRLIAAVQHLAIETHPAFASTARLAGYYVNGIRTQHDPSSPTGYWRGFLVDRNDWEMYAGLASGCMADIRLLPTYVRVFYSGLFNELPSGVPAPISTAPHR